MVELSKYKSIKNLLGTCNCKGCRQKSAGVINIQGKNAAGESSKSIELRLCFEHAEEMVLSLMPHADSVEFE